MSSNNKVNRKWRMKNLEAYKAHIIFNGAVRAGLIEPQPCEVCGKKAGGHHDDYSKPFEVRWLCPYHHRKFHHPEPPKRRTNNYERKGRAEVILSAPKYRLFEQAATLREAGKSYKEIALELGMTQGTIYKWLNPNKGYK